MGKQAAKMLGRPGASCLTAGDQCTFTSISPRVTAGAVHGSHGFNRWLMIPNCNTVLVRARETVVDVSRPCNHVLLELCVLVSDVNGH